MSYITHGIIYSDMYTYMYILSSSQRQKFSLEGSPNISSSRLCNFRSPFNRLFVVITRDFLISCRVSSKTWQLNLLTFSHHHQVHILNLPNTHVINITIYNLSRLKFRSVYLYKRLSN